MDPLYLDDLMIGQEFRSSEHHLDAAQIVSFAKQFDPQSFHMDSNAAQHSFFEGLAASGWHTMAITMKLIVQSVPFAHGIIGAGGEVTWPRPTRPGDILHVNSKVIDIRPSRTKPGRAFVFVRHLTMNQHDEVRQDFTARLLAWKRGATM